jgi:branched-chain amino acid transport system substrate-binding protein
MKTLRRTFLKGSLAAAGAMAVTRLNYARAQNGPIRIGVMYALSGVGAPVGNAFWTGTQLAALEVNKSGGLLGRQVELVIRDDKYNSATSVAAARELAGDGLNLLIGGSQTVTALGLAPLAPELKAVVMIAGAAGMPVTHELYNRNIFRTVSNNYTAYSSLGRAMIERYPNVKTWIAVTPEGDFGRDSALFFGNAVKKYSAKAGQPATVLDTVFAQATATDFKPQINAVMNTNAEGLYLGIAGAAQISFFQQARSVGMYEKFKVMGEVGNEIVTAKAMGRNMPPDLWSVSYWNPGLEPFKSNPLSQQLYTDYVAMTGDKAPPGLVMAGHRTAMALFEGIRQAKSTETDAVINGLEQAKIETVGGPFYFRNEDHQAVCYNFFAQMQPDTVAPFYKVPQMARVDSAEMIEPATPGKAFDSTSMN